MRIIYFHRLMIAKLTVTSDWIKKTLWIILLVSSRFLRQFDLLSVSADMVSLLQHLPPRTFSIVFGKPHFPWWLNEYWSPICYLQSSRYQHFPSENVQDAYWWIQDYCNFTSIYFVKLTSYTWAVLLVGNEPTSSTQQDSTGSHK